MANLTFRIAVIDSAHNVRVVVSDTLNLRPEIPGLETFAQVADTRVGFVRVSTVFLGVLAVFDRGERPHVFETMILTPGIDRPYWQRRCQTWEEALAQHRRAVRRVLFLPSSWVDQARWAWSLLRERL